MLGFKDTEGEVTGLVLKGRPAERGGHKARTLGMVSSTREGNRTPPQPLRRKRPPVLPFLGPDICSSKSSQHSVITERATPAKGPRITFLGAGLEPGGSGLQNPTQGPEFPDGKARKPPFKGEKVPKLVSLSLSLPAP